VSARAPRENGDARVTVLAEVSLRSSESTFDLLIFAVGYEARSRHVAQSLRDRYVSAVGIRFDQHEVLSFDENLAWAQAQSNIAVVTGRSEYDVSTAVTAQLDSSHAVESEDMHVLVDVSSFPRVHLAAIYSALLAFSSEAGPLTVEFVYAFSEFTAPPEEHGPVVEFGAVSPDFSGVGEAEQGLATIIGLGYESELALAVQEVLDPAVTWLAVPQSVDDQFDTQVQKSNELLLKLVDPSNVWSYEVDDPFSTFVELESIVHGLQVTHNVVLVPLGPKLLVLVCLLIATTYENVVGVWRLSPGGLRSPRDQSATGRVTSIAARFSPEAQSGTDQRA
jgi:hypothetical protein